MSICLCSRDWVLICVALAAAELMRDSGFQGFRCWCFEREGEWQGSWIVMADSCSLTKRLSVSQQTGTAALPLCGHTHSQINTRKHENTCTCAQARADVPKTTRTRTHLKRDHISFIWVLCACCGAEANPAFPLTARVQRAYYLCAQTAPTGVRDPQWIWKHLPDVNAERSPECKKGTKRLRLQRKWYSLF